MIIFVSGQIQDLDNVRLVQEAFVNAGHEITHDWIHNETGSKMLSGLKTKSDNADEAGRRAVNDMTGVINSDVFVICTDNEQVGKGMYAELGAAIALNMTTGSPKIYLLGSKQFATIFYYHPAIICMDTAQEIIGDLG